MFLKGHEALHMAAIMVTRIPVCDGRIIGMLLYVCLCVLENDRYGFFRADANTDCLVFKKADG